MHVIELERWMRLDARVDFTRLIAEMRRCELTWRRMAQETDIPTATLLRYAAGATPNHPNGDALIRLWQQVTGLPKDVIPRR